MNVVILTGRLTKDFAMVGKSARTSIAVKRDYGKDNTIDFIDIVAFGKMVDYVVKYARKGNLVSVVGCWNTYKKDGKTNHSCAISELHVIGKAKEEVEEDYPDDLPIGDDEDVSEQDIEDSLPF